MLDKNLTFGGVFFMSKYSYEFKLEVVKYCINNHYGFKSAANLFNIPSKVAVQQWVRKYQEHGCTGLYKNPKSSYSGKFKCNVVEYMHKNHLSLSETAIHFNLANHSIVSKWERIYYEKGPQALFEERRGRSKDMSSRPEKEKISKDNEKNLLKELEYLRAENAYLKKLDALVQERIKRENKKKQ